MIKKNVTMAARNLNIDLVEFSRGKLVYRRRLEALHSHNAKTSCQPDRTPRIDNEFVVQGQTSNTILKRMDVEREVMELGSTIGAVGYISACF